MEYPSPLNQRRYVDPSGVTWRIRGAELANDDRRWRRVARLMRDPDAHVLHVYLSDLTDVSPADREPLLKRLRQPPNDYTSFRVAEFKDASGRSMVVVEESC